MRRGIAVLGAVLGVFLIVRAIAEPFAIDMSDSATYRDDWVVRAWPECSPYTCCRGSSLRRCSCGL